MTTKIIFDITLIIVIIYIFFIYNVEHNSDLPDTNKQIIDAVKKIYQVDVEAIRNLSAVASNLLTENKLTIPGNINVCGEIIFKNCFALVIAT